MVFGFSGDFLVGGGLGSGTRKAIASGKMAPGGDAVPIWGFTGKEHDGARNGPRQRYDGPGDDELPDDDALFSSRYVP